MAPRSYTRELKVITSLALASGPRLALISDVGIVPKGVFCLAKLPCGGATPDTPCWAWSESSLAATGMCLPFQPRIYFFLFSPLVLRNPWGVDFTPFFDNTSQPFLPSTRSQTPSKYPGAITVGSFRLACRWLREGFIHPPEWGISVWFPTPSF